MRLYILAALFFTSVISVFARAESPALPVFPGSSVLKASSEESLYRLGLGAQKKIDGIWRAERLMLLKGRLERLTIELPAGFLLVDGLYFYEDSLSLNTEKLVYGCEGRDCGSSNSWANDHFKVRQLYGMEAAQVYRVYQDELKENYWVIYAVTRGNNRNYLQVEHLRM